MSNMRFAKFVFVLLAAALCSAAVPTPAEEKEIMAAMQAWTSAMVTRDAAALQRVMHDELVYSHSDTRVQTKADLIQDAKSGLGPAGLDLLESVVRVYGTTAVVKSKVVVMPNPAPMVATHVLVKGDAGWQLVSRQGTRPPPSPPSAR